MKVEPSILQLTASEVDALLKLWRASKKTVRDSPEEELPFILRLAESCSEAALLDQMASPGLYTDLNWVLACNPSLSPVVRRQLLEGHKDLRGDWAANWNPRNAEYAEDAALFQALASDPDPGVRCSLAANEKTPAELLHLMIGDNNPEVLIGIARHPSLAGEDALQLAHSPHVRVREAVLECVSREDVLRVLTNDGNSKIRSAALEKLPEEEEALAQ